MDSIIKRVEGQGDRQLAAALRRDAAGESDSQEDRTEPPKGRRSIKAETTEGDDPEKLSAADAARQHEEQERAAAEAEAKERQEAEAAAAKEQEQRDAEAAAAEAKKAEDEKASAKKGKAGK